MKTLFTRFAPQRLRNLALGAWALGVAGFRAQAQQWEPVPVVKQAVLDAGISPGGEGGQWPQALAADGTNGQFLLFGTDVGGIYRSLDGGARWEPCNVGYTPRGNSGFAIDPNNASYALAVGSNSGQASWHGLYLTTNKAASWKSVLPQTHTGYRDFREQVTYDRSSLSGGRSLVAYYSSQTKGLYKSTDGGATWVEINTGFGNSQIKTHPTNGTVYAANSTGFYRSTNGGTSFTKTLTADVRSLDVSVNAPNTVWVSQSGGVWKSTDSGQTFAKLAGTGLPSSSLRWVKVSPANAQRLVIWWQNPSNEYDRVRYYSTNGGASWSAASLDNSQATLPFNSRQVVTAWHPTNTSVLWSVGGDWITKSTDGGATYKWAGNGYNGILVGGMFNFNQQNPNVLFFGSQDYNGALTTNAGTSWQYFNVSGKGWGGFCYGGYAASASVLFTGDADSWGGTRTLRISRDGGATWTGTGIALSGANVSFGDPIDPNVLFAFNQRSTDQGRTWSPMTGCDGVFTASATGSRALYGRNGKNLVRSTDKGATWTVLTAAENGIQDVAFDPVRNYVYFVAGDRLRRWDGTKATTLDTPQDPNSYHRIKTVAVDPVDPAVVYAGTAKDIFASAVSVVRSVDAGATWQVLTVNAALNNTVDGGREALCIRVHPVSRYAYVATSCYGIWKIGPPAGGTAALPNGTYRLLAKHSGKALDVRGAGLTDTVGVVQRPASGAASQQWRVEATGNGYYQLTAQHSGKVLDVAGAGTANGVKVQQYGSNNTPAQRWKIEATSGGYYRLINQASGKCLDVKGVSQADGAPVHQWQYLGQDNQQWKLEPVTSRPATVATANDAASHNAEKLLAAYPNPAPGGRATLTLAAQAAQTATVYVRNEHGHLVSLLSVPVQAGATEFRLPTALPPGTYFLETRLDGHPCRFALRAE